MCIRDSISSTQNIPEFLEEVGRTCYKSEDKIGPGTAKSFIDKMLKHRHMSVLEHCAITVRVICDRGVSHEIVRHRIGMSYSQESTRYCNYSKDKFGNTLTFILPSFWAPSLNKPEELREWTEAMEESERKYLSLMEKGASPQQARLVLPNSLKTEIVITGNPVSWMHFFDLRCASGAHPQMREISCTIRKLFYDNVSRQLFEPVDGIWEDFPYVNALIHERFSRFHERFYR